MTAAGAETGRGAVEYRYGIDAELELSRPGAGVGSGYGMQKPPGHAPNLIEESQSSFRSSRIDCAGVSEQMKV